jgi:hypothetical protein
MIFRVSFSIFQMAALQDDFLSGYRCANLYDRISVFCAEFLTGFLSSTVTLTCLVKVKGKVVSVLN